MSEDTALTASDPPATLTPQETWRSLAPLLAGRSRMRPSRPRRSGIEYPRRLEQPLSLECPTRPTAVHVYDRHGYTRMLPLDLDAHDRTPTQSAAVQRDLAQLHTLFDELGVVHLVDGAHGGIHVYVLLEESMSANDVRTLVLALSRRLPTLDVGPTRSASDGLITIPGSAHRLGGHRELATSDADLRDIVDGRRTPPSVMRRMRMALADEVRTINSEDQARGEAVRETRRAAGEVNTLRVSHPDDLVIAQRGIGKHMSAKLADLARHGDWRDCGYPSASEARAAVLMSAVATGLSQTDVQARMLDGRWPGLRSLFDHKGLHRLSSEYNSVASELSRRETQKTMTRETSADISDTSATTHSGGAREKERSSAASVLDTHGVLRSWRTVLHRHGTHEFPGAPGWKFLLVLRALASNAHMVGERQTATGVRWIAVATGLGIDTVATVLRDLSERADPWIVLVRRGVGVRANEYELRIPERHEETASRARWVSGKAHALRPVFTVLGTPAALVYEAAEQGYSASYAHLMSRTGLGRDSVREAVGILSSWGLIGGSSLEGWTVSSTEADLERLAERLGATAARSRRLTVFREQRKRYHEFLATVRRRRRPAVRYLRDLEPEPPSDVQEVLDEMRAAVG